MRTSVHRIQHKGVDDSVHPKMVAGASQKNCQMWDGEEIAHRFTPVRLLRNIIMSVVVNRTSATCAMAAPVEISHFIGSLLLVRARVG